MQSRDTVCIQVFPGPVPVTQAANAASACLPAHAAASLVTEVGTLPLVASAVCPWRSLGHCHISRTGTRRPPGLKMITHKLVLPPPAAFSECMVKQKSSDFSEWPCLACPLDGCPLDHTRACLSVIRLPRERALLQLCQATAGPGPAWPAWCTVPLGGRHVHLT